MVSSVQPSFVVYVKYGAHIEKKYFNSVYLMFILLYL